MTFSTPSTLIKANLGLALLLLLGACGGGSSTTPASGSPVGPTRAAGCPSALVSAVLVCGAGTPITSAQLTAIVGTYNNGSANIADQLFVTNRGTVYYGTSPTEYTPSSSCVAGSDALLTFSTTSRILFSISSTAVTANGNAPTSPVTPVNNAAQSSCQF